MAMAYKTPAEFLDQINDLYLASKNKGRLLLPEEMERSPFFIMLQMLNIITDSIAESGEDSKDLFMQYYSVCLRGSNPFKDAVVKKAGIDHKEWKRLLLLLGGNV